MFSKPQPMIENAIGTTGSDTDNQNENITDGKTTNERRNEKISCEQKKNWNQILKFHS